MKNHSPKRNRKRNGLFVFLACFIFFSCENRAIYNQYQAVDNAVWEKDKEYYFTFQIEDNSIPYDVIFEVRNSNVYPYQNLWLFFNEERPVGPMVRDTVECMLADEFGRWKGSGISLFQAGIPIRSNYLFPDKGQYTINFRQGMRTDALKGIQEIGLRIEKAKR